MRRVEMPPLPKTKSVFKALPQQASYIPAMYKYRPSEQELLLPRAKAIDQTNSPSLCLFFFLSLSLSFFLRLV